MEQYKSMTEQYTQQMLKYFECVVECFEKDAIKQNNVHSLFYYEYQ